MKKHNQVYWSALIAADIEFRASMLKASSQDDKNLAKKVWKAATEKARADFARRPRMGSHKAGVARNRALIAARGKVGP